MRKLGFKIPISYVRIKSFKLFPKNIQREILRYQTSILDDSDYESDSVVVKKYKGKLNDCIFNWEFF